MNEGVRDILDAVAAGRLAPEQAERRLREEFQPDGFAELGHTKLDLARKSRRGVPEAVYCTGKTAVQVADIVQRIAESGQAVIATRCIEETAAAVQTAVPGLTYHAAARMLTRQAANAPAPVGLVAVLSAGTTDIPVAEEAALTASLLGSRVERVFDVGVAGIHRLFSAAGPLIESARVIVVAAGMEGALPSVVAGLARVPVIAVPTSVGYGAAFGGIAALLGMLNSCSGGVAVVNIDNGFGAGYLAHQINRGPECAAPSS